MMAMAMAMLACTSAWPASYHVPRGCHPSVHTANHGSPFVALRPTSTPLLTRPRTRTPPLGSSTALYSTAWQRHILENAAKTAVGGTGTDLDYEELLELSEVLLVSPS
eukprot:CAMPEP_0119502148 /NCGR_PEP_ID=MMETSP1344-20130328/23724_1 /TAXON_ID=236787 /ORGANISM="Florenciella parvula, Strain CCMP2471" /LENGTH=107 /DNA_ID=CAMNT_0007538349 /DNA_START=6 /DNA_END=326 /DNA_ORIENTATION=+